ncbi:unnamed protein product [Ixodes hexagonus]
MVACAVVSCANRTRSKNRRDRNAVSDARFFRLPKVITLQCRRTFQLSKRRRSAWVTKINRADLVANDNTHVCSIHFVTGAPSKLFDETNPDWVPSLKLAYTDKGDRSASRRTSRFERTRRRCNAKTSVHLPDPQDLDMESLRQDSARTPRTLRMSTFPRRQVIMSFSSLLHSDSFLSSAQALVEDIFKFSLLHLKSSVTKTPFLTAGTSVQTDLIATHIAAMEGDLSAVNTEVYTLRQSKEDYQLTAAALQRDPKKVKYYIGLESFDVLFAYHLIECAVHHSAANSLSKFQGFLVFLMKLRLNLTFQDLAFRFGVSEATISRVFDRWLHGWRLLRGKILRVYFRLKGQIIWPERRTLQRTMPQPFYDAFGDKVSVVLDCFEIKIERPSSLLLRAQTWSQYKSSNTAKFLIGIAPQGTTSFISEGWGGRTSAKHVTEHSGILDKLQPGDVVLPDRGFDISDSVGLHRAKLHIPAFTKGKQQLSVSDVETTRKLANVRIHVERVIGLVRNKYVILKSTLPVDFVACRPGDDLPAVDKMVTVCCALSNFSPSVVPINEAE